MTGREPWNVDAVRAIARDLVSGDASSHGWDHAERVGRLCARIGKAEGADLDVLALAACLHDIGRADEKASGGRVCHARVGAEKAGRVLLDLGAPAELVDRVAHCIATHRFRGDGQRPGSLEARVLFDADKLDAIGAVGIGRAFLFAGEVGARLHNPEVDVLDTRPYSPEDTAFREFSVKLRKVRRRMLTETGRLLAEERHRFMEVFFDRLTREVLGGC